MAQAAATGAGLADIAALDPADDPRAGIGMQQIAGTPAPYGRACTNCSKAKCKCIVRGDSGCERWVLSYSSASLLRVEVWVSRTSILNTRFSLSFGLCNTFAGSR